MGTRQTPMPFGHNEKMKIPLPLAPTPDALTPIFKLAIGKGTIISCPYCGWGATPDRYSQLDDDLSGLDFKRQPALTT